MVAGPAVVPFGENVSIVPGLCTCQGRGFGGCGCIGDMLCCSFMTRLILPAFECGIACLAQDYPGIFDFVLVFDFRNASSGQPPVRVLLLLLLIVFGLISAR